jgi:hypothetical protein
MRFEILFLAFFVVSPSLLSQEDPPRFFPLDEGNTWSYRSERFGWERDISVVERVDDLFRVQFGTATALLKEGSSGIEIQLPEDEERRTFFDFVADAFVHHDFFECDNGSRVNVAERGVTVETPAGVFEDCIVLQYAQGRCADAGTARQVLSPGVGLVEWSELNFAGIIHYQLVDFSVDDEPPPPPKFKRGDANSDERVDLADAVFTLGWLFLGADAPLCQDAADVNDDGGVAIDDAISLLGFLFLEGPVPPAPGPFDCLEDPTPDDLEHCGQECVS